MKLTNNEVLRESIKRILITVTLIVTLIILIGFITISYVVGNSIVQAKNKPLTYPKKVSTYLLLKMESINKDRNDMKKSIHKK